jgi:histidinol-phosphate phosphatase family protein
MRPGVVFLDKDGTLLKDVPYNVDSRRMAWEAGAAQGVRRLVEAGYRLVVVTNQAGVARGYFPEEALQGVAEHLNRMVEQVSGARLDGFYYCPHHPQGSEVAYAVDCQCRKPRPGMLLRAARELGIDLSTAWMVGDILNDVEAGKRAGCRAILIDNGGETEWKTGPHREPDIIAASLEEAADWIVGEGRAFQKGRTEAKQKHEQ